MAPVEGFVIQVEGGYLAEDGSTTNLQTAWSAQEYKDAEARAAAVCLNPEYAVAEYVVEDGRRRLAYEDAFPAVGSRVSRMFYSGLQRGVVTKHANNKFTILFDNGVCGDYFPGDFALEG